VSDGLLRMFDLDQEPGSEEKTYRVQDDEETAKNNSRKAKTKKEAKKQKTGNAKKSREAKETAEKQKSKTKQRSKTAEK
jgi:hypothetical protein